MSTTTTEPRYVRDINEAQSGDVVERLYYCGRRCWLDSFLTGQLLKGEPMQETFGRYRDACGFDHGLQLDGKRIERGGAWPCLDSELADLGRVESCASCGRPIPTCE